MLARGNEDFRAPGEHSFSLFQEENIPWSICVLLTSHWINIELQKHKLDQIMQETYEFLQTSA